MILGLTGLLAPSGTAAARDERPCKTAAEQLKAQLRALRQATEAVLRKSSEMMVDDIPDFEQDFSGIGAQFKALMNARGEVLALYQQALGGDCGGDLSARLGSVNETVTAYNAWRAGQDAALEPVPLVEIEQPMDQARSEENHDRLEEALGDGRARAAEEWTRAPVYDEEGRLLGRAGDFTEDELWEEFVPVIDDDTGEAYWRSETEADRTLREHEQALRGIQLDLKQVGGDLDQLRRERKQEKQTQRGWAAAVRDTQAKITRLEDELRYVHRTGSLMPDPLFDQESIIARTEQALEEARASSDTDLAHRLEARLEAARRGEIPRRLFNSAGEIEADLEQWERPHLERFRRLHQLSQERLETLQAEQRRLHERRARLRSEKARLETEAADLRQQIGINAPRPRPASPAPPAPITGPGGDSTTPGPSDQRPGGPWTLPR